MSYENPVELKWRNDMKNILIVLLIFYGTIAKAEPIVATDKAAHFGLSFAAQTVAYGYLKEREMTKVDALILSGAGVFAAGLLWELAGRSSDSKNDILANTLGQAASIFTIVRFDF